MKEPTTIGQRVKSVRKERGLSQKQLAHLAGISQQAVSWLEQDNAEGSKYIVPIAQALGVSPQWLQDGTGQKDVTRWDLVVDLSRLPPDVAQATREFLSSVEHGTLTIDQALDYIRATVNRQDG